MKRSQLKSPLGSPALQQTVRSKQKKGLGGESTASGIGGKGAAERRVEARARESRSMAPPPLPPVGPGVQVTPVEAKILSARWDKDMDELLREGVLRHGDNWEEVSTHMAPHECPKEEVEKRWQMVVDNPVKGPWSCEEDALLKILVEQYGSKKWSLIATKFPGRSGKQCRERWLNHLDTRVRKTAWTGGEDIVLVEAQGKLGNKWSEISKLLPGRAENAVKNRFNSIITKRMAQQGGGSKAVNGFSARKGGKGGVKGKGQQQKAGGTTPTKNQVRKTRAPIGFENTGACETDWDSSDGDDDDIPVYPSPTNSGNASFPMVNFDGISLGNNNKLGSNTTGAANHHGDKSFAGGIPPNAYPSCGHGDTFGTKPTTPLGRNAHNAFVGSNTRGATNLGTAAAASTAAAAAATAAGTIAAGAISVGGLSGSNGGAERGGEVADDKLMRSIYTLIGEKRHQLYDVGGSAGVAGGGGGNAEVLSRGNGGGGSGSVLQGDNQMSRSGAVEGAVSNALHMAEKEIEEEMQSYRQYQHDILTPPEMQSIREKVDRDSRESFSSIYSRSPTGPHLHPRDDQAASLAAALAASGAPGAFSSTSACSSVGKASAGKVGGKACAVPTRKAAMEIEAGGGVDVRDGQASAITESWSKVQIKGGEAGAPLRMGVGTRSLAAAVAGGAGGGGPYARGTAGRGGYALYRGGVGGGGGGISGEGAVVSSACANLDLFRADDVIPTPLEISSPGGAGDILSLSCLGSYLTDVKLPSGLDGVADNGVQATFSRTNERRSVSDSNARPMSVSSPSDWGGRRTSSTINHQHHNNATGGESNINSSRPSHPAGGKNNGAGVSNKGGGGRRSGNGAVLDANAELQNLASLSIDDDPSTGWSQLKTDVAGTPGPAFGADVLPMSLMSSSGDVIGGAQGFPVPPAARLRANVVRSPFPHAAYRSPYYASNLPPTPGFAASPRAPPPPQYQVYPLYSTPSTAAPTISTASVAPCTTAPGFGTSTHGNSAPRALPPTVAGAAGGVALTPGCGHSAGIGRHRTASSANLPSSFPLAAYGPVRRARNNSGNNDLESVVAAVNGKSGGRIRQLEIGQPTTPAPAATTTAATRPIGGGAAAPASSGPSVGADVGSSPKKNMIATTAGAPAAAMAGGGVGVEAGSMGAAMGSSAVGKTTQPQAAVDYLQQRWEQQRMVEADDAKDSLGPQETSAQLPLEGEASMAAPAVSRGWI